MQASTSCIITDDRPEFAAIKGKRCSTKLNSSSTSSSGVLSVDFTWKICNYSEGDYEMHLHVASHFRLWYGNTLQYSRIFDDDNERKLMPGECITQTRPDEINLKSGGRIMMEAQLEGDATSQEKLCSAIDGTPCCQARGREVIDLEARECQVRVSEPFSPNVLYSFQHTYSSNRRRIG